MKTMKLIACTVTIMLLVISCIGGSNKSAELDGLWEHIDPYYPDGTITMEFSGKDFTWTGFGGYEVKGTFVIDDDTIELTPVEGTEDVWTTSFSRDGDTIFIDEIEFNKVKQ